MGIYYGSNKIGSIYEGSNKVGSVSIGNQSIYSDEYKGLTFTALGDGCCILFSQVSMGGTPTLNQNFSYSFDGLTWIECVFDPCTQIFLDHAGDKVYFKGNNPNGVSQDYSLYYNFSTGGNDANYAVSGNIMSLIDNGACTCTTIPNDYCFYRLFGTSVGMATGLVSAPDLPATILTQGCYRSMFEGCTFLTTAPKLPASTWASDCFRYMFMNCTSLTTPPSLINAGAWTSTYCQQMFTGCTSLQVNDAPIAGVAEQIWRIPAKDTFTDQAFTEDRIFTNCAGTRSSDDMTRPIGQFHVYYTQNAPV